MSAAGMKENVKYGVEYLFNAHTLRQIPRRERRRIYVMLTPQYLNYGDHAIAYAELAYLREAFVDWDIFEINYNVFQLWRERVLAVIQPEDVIIVTGGGFMGNLWPENESLVEEIIRLFPNNRIIFAPQTLYFRPGEQSEQDKERLNRLLEGHKSWHFFGRDRASCEKLGQMGFVEGRDYQYLPDFVLFMSGLVTNGGGRDGAILCLRDDGESVADNRPIFEALSNTRYSKLRMAVSHAEIPVVLRERMLSRKLKQYARAEFLITDRLHAMLFAAYTGTPCVAMDNISKKVSGVYEWIRSLEYIAVAKNADELKESVERVRRSLPENNHEQFIRLQAELKAQYLPRFARQITSEG